MKTNKSPFQPDHILDMLGNISSKTKSIFFSTLIIGFIAHGFCLTNKLTNADDLLAIRAYGAMLDHGRYLTGFLGPFISQFAGNYANPWMEGLICLVLLALSACMVSKTLELKNLYSCILVGGVMAVFPTIVNTFDFMFCASYYMFAIFLTTLAAECFVHGNGWKFKVGGVLLAAGGMGIYQAYFPFLAGLLLIVLMKKALLDENVNAKDLWREALHYLVDLAATMATYFVILKVTCAIFNGEVTSSSGINRMGHLAISELPGIIIGTYQHTFSMLVGDYMGVSADWLIRLMIGGCFVAVLLAFGIESARMIKEKQFGKLTLAWIFLLGFPVAINLIDVMCGGTDYTPYVLMEYALLLIFVLPMALWENHKLPWMRWVCALAGCVVVFYYTNLANEAYLYVEIAQTAERSFYTSVVTQIRETKGYTSDVEVVLYGEVQEHAIYPLETEFKNLKTNWRGSAGRANASTEGFLKYYCGFYPTYATDVADAYAEEVEKMPCYPDEGSIQILGNQAVVKFSDVENE